MKKYSEKDLDQFFFVFKELPNTFPLEKVHQLIHSPIAKAKQAGKKFNILKLFIMTNVLTQNKR